VGPDFYAITTPQGRIVVELSKKTPYHRAAFQQSVEEGVYDSTLFHRVIQGFMIQGGDPLSKNENPADDGRGEAWPDLVRAEFDTDSVRTLFHRRGALAAARQGDFVNPERKSGGQFYLVQGRVFFDAELDAYERVVQERTAQPGFRYSPEEREAYATVGGAPQLDQQYTVFGYVVEGMEVVDQIAAVPVRPGPNRPLDPVRMTITPLPDYTPPAPTAPALPADSAETGGRR
jgi:peptidyl-prolyl cis-trans isomerase B (cyclophilin B)